MDWIGRLLRSRRAGEESLAWHRSGLDAAPAIGVTSPDFRDDTPIPKRNAGRPIGENVSSALQWSGVPPTAQELVLIVEDADVPFSRPIVHAIARLAPDLTGLAEGDLEAGGAHGEGRGSFDRPGYHGPRPIPGHGPHHYVFQLFALDRPIPGDSTLRPRTIMAAMSGHVLARGRLTGTYER
ncbi:YbhB/YbcL family Raf kinase inhibitor-like protein [Leifsonia sp. fls2-241-R2A-40a]|uniref:YbhB/YbcL family Raf kinase inhibitor-like protein n=1 Tax=Leifsonia sp. fls2-241-R2A-40a TaxID=3040290 RepID=UPI00254DAEED|nr:YbhB/YbcL family Raf kinase inhibitor-like protein [Leifsonia sp. fls2-241-R2A-40a]